MSGNCTTCANRVKHHGMDDGGGDFWRCTAVPIIPAFTGMFQKFTPQLVNLRSFDDDHPCHKYQRAKTCPLHTRHAQEQRDVTPTLMKDKA